MNLSTKPPKRWTAAVNSANSSFCRVRISSGSSCSLSEVKPLRSANSTVTGRRSASASGPASCGGRPLPSPATTEALAVPAATAGTGGGAAGRAVGFGAPATAAPHWGQNAKSGAQG